MSKLAVLAKLTGIDASDAHEGSEKGFVRTSKAWYASAALGHLTEDFTIGFYHQDGGTTGEFSISFEDRADTTFVRLNVHDDAFHALLCMPELLVRLAEHDFHHGTRARITPDLLEEILLELGFTNRTATRHPGAA